MKKSIIILTLIAMTVTAYAQSEKVALPFTKISQNPLSTGMGGAYLASTSVHGFLANPAMMGFSGSKGDFSLSANYWQPSQTTYMNFSGALCFKERFTVSFGGNYGMGKTYETIIDPELEPELFRPSDLMVGAGFGIKMGKYLAVGANIRYEGQTLSKEAKLGTIGADILLSTKVKGFSATLGVVNLGGKLAVTKNASTKYSMPASFDLGLGYKIGFADNHEIEALADLGYFFHGDFYTSLGAAYTLMNIFSVRAGYHYGKLIPSYGSVGLGGNIKGFRIDCAYIFSGKENPVGNSVSIALGYRF